MQESGHHLLALINDIPDFSRIEAGQAEIYFEQVHLPSVCQDSLQLVHEAAGKSDGSRSTWPSLRCAADCQDQRLLKQILVNLLCNAVKFTPEGEKLGWMWSTTSLALGCALTCGIRASASPKQLLPLQPFAQLDSSLNRHYNGTGLGLALVHRMTHMHGGSVKSESQLGVGSRFTILLPCCPPRLAGPNCPTLAHSGPTLWPTLAGRMDGSAKESPCPVSNFCFNPAS